MRRHVVAERLWDEGNILFDGTVARIIRSQQIDDGPSRC